MANENLDSIIEEFDKSSNVGFRQLIKWESMLDDPYDKLKLYNAIVMNQLLSANSRKSLEDGLVGYIKGQNTNAVNMVESLATEDSLTGLANGRGYEIGVKRILMRARRAGYESGSKTVGFVFIDVNDFKVINDMYGHSFGDFVLRYVGDAIEQFTRTTDLSVRRGGDEFVIILDPITKNDAETFLRKLNKKINEYVGNRIRVEHHKKNVNFRISMGMALYGKEAKSERELMLRADKAMYYAKKHALSSGRLNYHIYDERKKHLYMNNQDRKGR